MLLASSRSAAAVACSRRRQPAAVDRHFTSRSDQGHSGVASAKTYRSLAAAAPKIRAWQPRQQFHSHRLHCRGSSPEDEEGQTSGTDADESPAATSAADLVLSREVVDRLRSTVFSFDSFFVTSVENYDANGVLFKGNLRGDAATSHSRLSARLQEELGDDFVLYLLADQEDKPCVVVFPTTAVQGGAPSAAVEVGLALLLGMATVGFSMASSSGLLTETGESFNAGQLADGIPFTLSLLVLLGA
mmetsp:Transcript_30657/g.86713  ORF Transcript_30657/g.86713 Transcript_30657/m.86713 type:complete len:245 (-) Transcript_30657:26-760(-)